MTFEQWLDKFQSNYFLRTKITWEDGGGDIETAEKYFDNSYSPEDAVWNEITKYGMTDYEEEWHNLSVINETNYELKHW